MSNVSNLTPEGVQRGLEKSMAVRAAKKQERIAAIRLLRDKEGLGTGEIAKRLGISKETVRRALKS